jgi:hypothetical protein
VTEAEKNAASFESLVNNEVRCQPAIQKRREESIPTEHEEGVRQQILDGLIADKGGDERISKATRILAEVIASDASWLQVWTCEN